MIRFTALMVLAIASLAMFGTPYLQACQQHLSHGEFSTRSIKALSEQQMADLRAGRGMGLALAAELNGYPGPRHVLEHADALGLSPEQRHRTQALFEAMLAETVPIGEQVIEREGELEQLFASRSVTPASLLRTTDAIAAAMGALRAAHLGYHLAMMDVLTAEQVRRYGELRGHGSGHSDGGQGHDASHQVQQAH